MINLESEAIGKFLEKDESLKKAYKAHRDYEKKIEALDKKSPLTPRELLERDRLKKLKLAVKDEITRMVERYKH